MLAMGGQGGPFCLLTVRNYGEKSVFFYGADTMTPNRALITGKFRGDDGTGRAGRGSQSIPEQIPGLAVLNYIGIYSAAYCPAR